MAGRKTNHLLFAPASLLIANSSSPPDGDEFEESDVWGYVPVSGDLLEMQAVARAEAAQRAVRKGVVGADHRAPNRAAASSVPVNIPDWSNILGSSYVGGGGNMREWLDCGYCEDGEEEAEALARPIIPPHELLCRSRGASFSVHEGAGRTLKGRDLSRVRNAIWAKTGFED